MTTRWKDLKHKASPEARETAKREALAEYTELEPRGREDQNGKAESPERREGVQWSTIAPMHGVVETPAYLKDAEAIFTAGEREAIVTMVAGDPQCGEVMQGTGGVRKVRVGRGGRGKSGGGRVVYIHHDADHPIFLLAAFAKNEKSNLSQAERNELAKFVKALFKPSGGNV